MINKKLFKTTLKLIFILVSLLFSKLLFATIEDQEDQNANTELSKILNKIQYINADFSQIVLNKLGTILQEQTGTIKLKKPNLLNWQVLQPDRLSIIMDGEKIWNYDIDLEQIVVKKISNIATEDNNLIIKLLFDDLIKNLNQFKVNYSTDLCEAELCFRLSSNDAALKDRFGSFNAYYLGFNRDQQLVLLKLIDVLEQETIFKFFNFKNHINPKDFNFIVPAGVDLIEE